jgi:CheY-like chemotaxis protein
MLSAMSLSALLVCVDEASTPLLQRVLEELKIRVESCPDFVRAGIRLAQERYDAVILDGQSVKQVISLLRETRQSRKNDATLAIAVLPGQESAREIFSLGANFIFYKPLAYEQALSSLRAVRSVMQREKRKKSRATVHAQATIDYANVEREKAALIDLAEDGMSVQFGKKLPPVGKVYFQFRLPGQTVNIRLSGQLVWQDWKGRAGVRFADVPKSSRRLLGDFLGAHLPREAGRDPFYDVTVEMEETLQPAAVAVAELTHGRSYERDVRRGVERENVSAKSPQASIGQAIRDSAQLGFRDNSHRDIQPDVQAGLDNRRTQTRYACRLSAEVYRPGLSIPHRCCLTDLSSGGCFLEVALPFPQGSTLDIVVRTYEMRLRLKGTVLTSHPGYGMGVAFELDTQEEQDRLKRLTDFVAANDPSA